MNFQKKVIVKFSEFIKHRSQDVQRAWKLCEQTRVGNNSGWAEFHRDSQGAFVFHHRQINHDIIQGFDQTINLILDETHERVFSASQGVEQVENVLITEFNQQRSHFQVVLGLHIVRGDNICVVGEIDEDIDQRLDLHNIKAEPLNAGPHGAHWHNPSSHSRVTSALEIWQS